MYIIAIIISIVLITIDQITKYIAVEKLMPVGKISIIDGVFNLTYVENRGAAFGMMQGARWFFVVLTAIILAIIIYYYIKLPKDKTNNWIRVSLVLISSGAIGNFIDRAFNGFVVDFLHFSLIDFPVFNVADMYVVIGTCLLALIMLLFVKEEGENAK